MEPFLRRCMCLLLPFILVPPMAVAQEPERGKGIFFPTPMYDRNWHASIGFVTFATPGALTEEFRNRVPALDLQLLRQVHGGLHLNARTLIQVLQNHASAGLRWATPLNERWYLSVGAEYAMWKGHLLIDEFDTDGNGAAVYPGLSIGFRPGKDVRLTLRTEGMFTLFHRTRVGAFEIERDVPLYNGMAWSLYVEQPFVGRSHVALGFTARHTNFFWATWALFDTYEHPFLYRQITIAFIP